MHTLPIVYTNYRTRNTNNTRGDLGSKRTRGFWAIALIERLSNNVTIGGANSRFYILWLLWSCKEDDLVFELFFSSAVLYGDDEHTYIE